MKLEKFSVERNVPIFIGSYIHGEMRCILDCEFEERIKFFNRLAESKGYAFPETSYIGESFLPIVVHKNWMNNEWETEEGLPIPAPRPGERWMVNLILYGLRGYSMLGKLCYIRRAVAMPVDMIRPQFVRTGNR